MQHLKVGLIQTEIVWQNAEENRLQFSKKINEITETVDVIVLPEMFSTGFCMQPQKIAETMQGETLQWMQKLALEKQAAIAGSIIICEDKKYYNRFLFVHPSGEINTYDKRHLFTLAGEDEIYTSGTKKLVVNYKGWKICPLICYDLRFPVWARNTENYDVLLYVANWPKPRIEAWDTLLKARAIENMCYSIGVNRIGVDANNLEYNGHTAMYNCLGEKLANTTDDKEETVIVELAKNHILETRSKLNFLADKDSFTVQL